VRFFDRYLAVDWSARAVPATGADSIWMCSAAGAGVTVRNPPTRTAAMDAVGAAVASAVASGRTLLVGFDFSFAYPAGLASLLGRGGEGWRGVWDELVGRVEDDRAGRPNDNNRFAVADALNRATGHRLFWGRPPTPSYRGLAALPVKKSDVPAPLAPNPLAELRRAERSAGGRIGSTWQVGCGVSVGGQTLVGVPRLARLRATFPGSTRIWPLETGLLARPSDLPAPVVVAEIWPSLFFAGTPEVRGSCKDEAQVRSAVSALATADRDGLLGAWLAPATLRSVPAAGRDAGEEGWILGVA
jgi:hypothetical protein